MRVRVGIVDDHPAVVHGASTLLRMRDEIQVVATGSSVGELLAWSQPLDVALLDPRLRDESRPADNIRRLEEIDCRVLIYTTQTQLESIRADAVAGAVGLVLKSEEAGPLQAAVRAAARGELPDADWTRVLVGDARPVSAGLTARESEVLRIYASGETTGRVASQLYISRETVQDHIRRIRAKYAAVGRPAKTKIDLFRRASEDGILSDSGPQR